MALVFFVAAPVYAAFEPEQGGYRLVWSDEFDCKSRPDPKNWDYEKGFVRNHELQYYQEDNASCKDGKLVIEGKRDKIKNPSYRRNSKNWKEQRRFSEYSSASINTKDKHYWKYGRFIVRAKVTDLAGLWPAIWFLGKEGEWPARGEIDLMEYFQNKIHANVASGTKKRWTPKWDANARRIASFHDPSFDKKFHIWRMDWDEQSIKLYMDDILLNETLLKDTVNPDGVFPRHPFHQPHYILLNFAIGGKAGGDPSQTPFPQYYEVDYVRIYQK